MNNLQLKQICLEIQNNLRCVHCGKPYTPANIHLRSAFRNIYLFHLVCENHSAMATITVVGDKNQIDLAPITTSDVLGFHHQLQDFNGNFRQAFKSPRQS